MGVCGRVGELNKQRVATAVGPRSVEAAAATASPAIWGSRAERAVDGPAGGRAEDHQSHLYRPPPPQMD